MPDERLCPMSAEDREKYCLCETCQFMKKCLEDIEKTMKSTDKKKNEK